MDKLYEDSETGCCPRFDPGPWDEKEITLQDKLFLKDHVTSFFRIPLNMNKVMAKNMERIKNANALAPLPMTIADEKSMWGADVYIAVNGAVPGSDMVKISGTFLAKVFEGPYKNAGKWVNEMKAFVGSKGKELNGLYFFYTTCPRCAEYYGKNYVVLLAKV